MIVSRCSEATTVSSARAQQHRGNPWSWQTRLILPRSRAWMPRHDPMFAAAVDIGLPACGGWCASPQNIEKLASKASALKKTAP